MPSMHIPSDTDELITYGYRAWPDADRYDLLVNAWLDNQKERVVRAKVTETGVVELTPFNNMRLRKPVPNVCVLGGDPKWVSDRIYALMLTDLPPPPNPIDEIGMRIDERTFWIVAPEDW